MPEYVSNQIRYLYSFAPPFYQQRRRLARALCPTQSRVPPASATTGVVETIPTNQEHHDRNRTVVGLWELSVPRGKLSNPFVNEHTCDDYLNKLTTWRFERVCRRVALRIARKEAVPFSCARARGLKTILAWLPYLSDGLVVYQLEKDS